MILSLAVLVLIEIRRRWSSAARSVTAFNGLFKPKLRYVWLRVLLGKFWIVLKLHAFTVSTTLESVKPGIWETFESAGFRARFVCAYVRLRGKQWAKRHQAPGLILYIALKELSSIFKLCLHKWCYELDSFLIFTLTSVAGWEKPNCRYKCSPSRDSNPRL